MNQWGSAAPLLKLGLLLEPTAFTAWTLQPHRQILMDGVFLLLIKTKAYGKLKWKKFLEVLQFAHSLSHKCKVTPVQKAEGSQSIWSPRGQGDPQTAVLLKCCYSYGISSRISYTVASLPHHYTLYAQLRMNLLRRVCLVKLLNLRILMNWAILDKAHLEFYTCLSQISQEIVKYKPNQSRNYNYRPRHCLEKANCTPHFY